MATWFQGSADGFIEANRQGWARGVRILHFLGGSSIDVSGDRAVSQTKMTISQRAEVHGALCDVVCTGRFYDFFERRDGRWGLVLRQPIYEKDRLDPVDPSARRDARPRAARALPRGLPPPRLPPDAGRLRRQAATCRGSKGRRSRRCMRAEPAGCRAHRPAGGMPMRPFGDGRRVLAGRAQTPLGRLVGTASLPSARPRAARDRLDDDLPRVARGLEPGTAPTRGSGACCSWRRRTASGVS